MKGQRKYDSGSQTRKTKERRDMVIQSFEGSMDRYVKRKPNQPEHKHANENVNVNVNTSLDENNAYDLNENEHVDVLNKNIDDFNDNTDDLNDLNENEHVDDLNDNIEDLNKNVDDLKDKIYDLCDPGNWKINISLKERDLIVGRGPKGLSSPLTSANQGYNDWRNISCRLMEHEKSGSHMLSMKAWIEKKM
ncbi:hypothetical protein Ddye_013304 [Dipteronia dyeriana]|uniref:Uncharacterized protein n=1 Tax=Dipteronia dyeriana TaxID=168575 RepID=A0AAD9X604_9ROSI|nr:hypothetical protein Ddye_013304 [Dipteronia dyeriana]